MVEAVEMSSDTQQSEWMNECYIFYITKRTDAHYPYFFCGQKRSDELCTDDFTEKYHVTFTLKINGTKFNVI